MSTYFDREEMMLHSRQLAIIATWVASIPLTAPIQARFYDVRDTNLLNEVLWQEEARQLTRGDLYGILYAEDPDPRHESIWAAIEAADTEILPYVREVQEKETDRSSLGSAYMIMARMKGDVLAALPQARGHLQDADFCHRMSSLQFLAKRGTAEDRRRVVGMLRDENSHVVLATALAVRDMQDPLLLDAAEVVLQERIARVTPERADDRRWGYALKALAEGRKMLKKSGARTRETAGPESSPAPSEDPDTPNAVDPDRSSRLGPSARAHPAWPLLIGGGTVVLLALLLVGWRARRRNSAADCSAPSE